MPTIVLKIVADSYLIDFILPSFSFSEENSPVAEWSLNFNPSRKERSHFRGKSSCTLK